MFFRVNTSILDGYVEGETEIDHDRAMFSLGVVENLKYDDEEDLEGDDDVIQINYIVELLEHPNVSAGE